MRQVLNTRSEKPHEPGIHFASIHAKTQSFNELSMVHFLPGSSSSINSLDLRESLDEKPHQAQAPTLYTS